MKTITLPSGFARLVRRSRSSRKMGSGIICISTRSVGQAPGSSEEAERSFDSAVAKIQSNNGSGGGIKVTNDVKLRLYGLYKQATEGNCTTDKPSFFNVVESAKWSAWKENKDMGTHTAKAKYIELVESIGVERAAVAPGISSDPRGSLLYNVLFPRRQRAGEFRSLNAPTIKTSMIDDHVARVSLSRPEKSNALNAQMWHDFVQVFETVRTDGRIRAVILDGQGTHFCSGMDLSVFSEMQALSDQEKCEGRKREALGETAISWCS